MPMTHDNHRAQLNAHHADCTECQDAPLPLDRIATFLETAAPAIDAAALSRQTFAQLRPELQRRAMAVGWRRIAIGLLLSLLPLPLVLAYNVCFLRLMYGILSALLPGTLATYLVLSYGAFLVLLFATTYAAIPLLVVHRPFETPAAPA